MKFIVRSMVREITLLNTKVAIATEVTSVTAVNKGMRIVKRIVTLIVEPKQMLMFSHAINRTKRHLTHTVAQKGRYAHVLYHLQNTFCNIHIIKQIV